MSIDELGRFLADDMGDDVSGPVTSATAELRKRRSTRIVQAVPLMVSGVDALGRPFTEHTSSLIVNCHGCRYQSKHYVLKNMWVSLEVPHAETGQPPRAVRGRVAWIQRPRTVRQLFQIALELEVPGNAWGIAFPPEDWFAFPDAAEPKLAVAAAAAAAAGASHAAPTEAPVPAAHEREAVAASPAAEPNFASSPNEAEPHETLAPDNVREFPALASATDASLHLARQVTRLLADARQQIQAAAREAAAQAVSAERRLSAEEWEHKLAEARTEFARELAAALETIQRESVLRGQEAQNAATEALQKDVPRWLNPQLEEVTRNLAAHLSQEGLMQRNAHAELIASGVESLQSAHRQAEEVEARLRELAEQSHAQISGRTEASLRAMEDTASRLEQSLAAQRDSLSAAAAETQQQVTSSLSSAQANWQSQLAGEMEAAQLRAQTAIDNALSSAQSQAASSLDDHANALLAQFQREVERLANEFREATQTASAEPERRLATLHESLQAGTDRVEAALAHANEVSARLERFPERIEASQRQSLDHFQLQVDDVLSTHRNELHRRSESLFDELNTRIRVAFEESSSEAVAQFGHHVESLVQPQVSQVQDAIHRLAGGRSMLDAAMSLQQERIRVTADEAFAEALAQFRGNLGSVEQVLRDSADSVAARALADLETKAESAKHEAVQDLMKSAEWYEKKAQTQIQHFTEKASEQAGQQLHEKAGEISSVFAAELDNASRNFIGHTQTQMEEVVRDSFERTRALLSEAADTTSAAFIDEIQRNARQELGGFEAEVQKSAHETRAQLEAAHAELTSKVTAEQESFLRRFQGAMQGVVEAGVAEANQRVQAGFTPLLESWDSMTEARQAEARGLYARVEEQAAEQYRGRLENVSKQWMLATVASLDHQSRDVVAGIAATAEERLRDTCSKVFSDIGEALRERLRQIATNFSVPVPPATP